MNSDMADRLRALASALPGAEGIVKQSLREAADALEAEETRRMMLNTSNGEWSKRFHALEQERDGLKAELVDAESRRALLAEGVKIFKAELAEAKAEEARYTKAFGEEREFQVRRAEKAEKQRDAARAEAAALKKALERYSSDAWKSLSQPGPGAQLLERVKKLEAVAEAARVMMDGSRPPGVELAKSDMLAVAKALSALEEEP